MITYDKCRKYKVTCTDGSTLQGYIQIFEVSNSICVGVYESIAREIIIDAGGKYETNLPDWVIYFYNPVGFAFMPPKVEPIGSSTISAQLPYIVDLSKPQTSKISRIKVPILKIHGTE